MTSIHVLLVIHLLGFGTLFGATVGGWILHSHCRNAGDYQSKVLLLKSLRPFGILSLIAVLVVVASGIGNMVYFGLGPFSEGWLSAKLVIVFIVVVNGIVFGTRSVRRGKLVVELAEGGASEHTHTRINALDKQLSIFYATQLILLLVVLVLSVVRP